ncbi:glycosyltransferase [Ornithinimicrobium sp. W1665]|uniref:glycosyltransferase n=1 Tax=Ornithinimicrobium sp. W1665 TaxID=3416666 RepID=UPI003CF02454
MGVTATREFVGLVEAAGLAPEPVDVDAMAYYRDQLAVHAMPTDLGGQLRMLRGLAELLAPSVRRRLEDMRPRYDGLVLTAMTAGWPALAGWPRAPRVLMMFVPALPTTWGDSSMFSVVPGRSWRNLAAAVRILPTAVRLVAPDPRAALSMGTAPAFVAHSPRLVTPRRVAGRQVRAVGYPFRELPDGASLDPGLAAWLDAGPAPVYVGLGSHTLPSVRAVLSDAVAAASDLGLRVVLQGGSGLEEGLGPDVRVVEDVPHELLFPRTATVVHHGGAGTTAQALRSGRPQVVVPFTMDQPFFARRVHEIGVGPPPVPASSATRTAFREALAGAGRRPVLERAAAEAAAVAVEDGVSGAVARIEAALGAGRSR